MMPITVPNSPLRYRDTPQMKSAPSPELGQHNDEIYGGILGLSPAEIASLRKEGAI